MKSPRRRKTVILSISIALIGLVIWIGYQMQIAVYGLPDTYAAWDTGTLLVDYMKSHENHWPTSWDDLLKGTVESQKGSDILLRGTASGIVDYAKSLRQKVTVDWSFDPHQSGANSKPVVTRADGSEIRLLWFQSNPNDLVHEYLAATRSTSSHN